jgi:hypothetical protein
MPLSSDLSSTAIMAFMPRLSVSSQGPMGGVVTAGSPSSIRRASRKFDITVDDSRSKKHQGLPASWCQEFPNHLDNVDQGSEVKFSKSGMACSAL